ncbi:LCP family protein [Raoultibacter phocaeensis]|uniref:LCP family protein n=1 Tax=Raoultibacter phocaeensis TaxID=2479841 RepID=UPI002729C53E|nr:LCP family protein [Raoultibacter phocaeensis]
MASRNPQSNRPPRSSHTPPSVRAARSARAAQSGRIASKSAAQSFARQDPDTPTSHQAYRSAYTPGSQGKGANSAYARQAPASGQYSRNNPQYSKAAKKKGRGKKIAIGVVCTLLVLVLGGGTAMALYVNNINNALQGDKSEEEKMAIQDVLAPKKSFNEPFYIMLIGSDAREDSDEMGQRSDTNIVVRVDPTTCVVSLVSIPRDTMIDIDGYGRNKFNAAYNYGGASATIKEANQLLGVDISHYAEINFEKLIELVDVIGGVEIDVQDRINDPDAGPVIIEAGLQTLNGEAALVYARSRMFVDGDFTRTTHQRELIEAIVKKVLSLPVTDLPGVIEKAASCVTTDLSVSDIIALATQFQDLGKLTMYSAMVPTAIVPYLIDGVSYVVSDGTSLAEMMKLVEAGEDPSVIDPAPAFDASMIPSGLGGGEQSYSNSYDSYSYEDYSGNDYSYNDGGGYQDYGGGSGYPDQGGSGTGGNDYSGGDDSNGGSSGGGSAEGGGAVEQPSGSSGDAVASGGDGAGVANAA